MTKTFKLPLAFIALACTLPVAAPALAQDGVLVGGLGLGLDRGRHGATPRGSS